jgi:hypothetical protein
MIVIPTRITNIVFLIRFVLATGQHGRLNQENPVTNLQFIVMVCSISMLLVVTLNHTDTWLSLAFFLIAVGSLAPSVRQRRKLHPAKHSSRA